MGCVDHRAEDLISLAFRVRKRQGTETGTGKEKDWHAPLPVGLTVFISGLRLGLGPSRPGLGWIRGGDRKHYTTPQ